MIKTLGVGPDLTSLECVLVPAQIASGHNV